MTEDKKISLLATINAEWDSYEDKAEMAKAIEHSLIFGPLDDNFHVNIDEITSLIKEVELEKNPIINNQDEGINL